VYPVSVVVRDDPWFFAAEEGSNVFSACVIVVAERP
jgi:hypothetical protein